MYFFIFFIINVVCGRVDVLWEIRKSKKIFKINEWKFSRNFLNREGNVYFEYVFVFIG